VEPPADRAYDGYDLSPVLLEGAPSPRSDLFYYRGGLLFAVRYGPWKAHFRTQTGYTEPAPTRHDPPLLFHLEEDPGERFDRSASEPDVIERILRLTREHEARMERGENQLVKQADRPTGVFTAPPAPR
jgi:hypothetical protein